MAAALFGVAALAGCDGTPHGPSAAAGSAAAPSAEGPTATPPKPRDPSAIDLRTLPPWERATFTIHTADRLEGIAGGKAAAIFAHYRAALEKLGWSLSSPMSKDQATDESASTLLQKGGDAVFLSVSPNVSMNGKIAADEKLLSIGNLGACDSSKLPRLPGAEKGYDKRLSTVYFTDMKVAATAESVRNLLLHDGWQAFAKPFGVKTDSPNFVREEFRKRGNSLRVLVSAASINDKKVRSSVEYLIGAIGHQLPAQPEATEVVFDDTLCLLQCKVPRELRVVADYYRGAMADLGYEAASAAPATEAKAVIVFKSKDQEPLVLELNNYDRQYTHINLMRVGEEGGKK